MAEKIFYVWNILCTEFEFGERQYVFFKYEDQTISAKPGDIFLIQPNVLHAIMSDEHSSFFYDTIVFHQNMLVGSYDDRCYTDILLSIFSSRRRVLVPVSQAPGVS